MSAGFVHLHTHTEYSIVDGLLRIPELVKQTAALGMPAIAVTEAGNLFSLVKFYRVAEAAGIKPIIGAEVAVSDMTGQTEPDHVLLLCQDLTGYHNLCRLITDSYISGQFQNQPRVARDNIREYHAGLLAISCAHRSDINRSIAAGQHEAAARSAAFWQEIFADRYSIEIVRCGRPEEEDYILNVTQLAATSGIALIASNDVRFLHADDFEAHEVRVCIQQGRTLNDPRRSREYTPQQYLRSADEMQTLFADMPETLANTLAIAERCNLELEFGHAHMPDYPVPEGYDQSKLLIEQTQSGLETRVLPRARKRHGDIDETVYRNRLERELDVVTSMGFAGYFLIVADFIRWAREQGIPVGPGRGSGAGSLVAYAIGITALDPLDYDLLFERFLNPERVSLPDFDIDFCMERRDEVIAYVAERYGRDQVSQIITYGSMAAKAVVRDVGRALGHPYGFVDQIAKLIPFALDMTLTRALEEEETLRARYEDKNEEEVGILIDLALKLEGLCRNAGRHAGGVVIAPRPLTEFMPLYAEQGSQATVTQFDMGDVEAVGLVKFDFLGLRTLTIIEWAVRDINRLRQTTGEPELDISTLPLDDKASFELIQRTDTMAVFQLESDGMRKLIKRLQPDRFEDLVALVALFRPGPLQSGMVDDFVDRKHGRARIDYALPALEPVLKPTYGVILYQEQVMQIAQVLAGYTLGGADLLRRAMGKKKPEEMAQQRDIFVSGAVANHIDEKIAVYIFDLMEKFAGYGFNKSHSAAYALIAYQTAWLKAHYPAAFMAAVLSSDMDNTDKIVLLCEEVRRMQLTLEPPSINTSRYEFSVADLHTIRFGLGAVKGVGHSAIDAIIEAREQQPFTDLFDFCRRCDLKRVNRRVLEALIRCGAMDDFGHGRNTLLGNLDRAIQLAEQSANNDVIGMTDLFGLAPAQTSDGADLTPLPEWSDDERLRGEKDTLGFYLSGHPIERYENELTRFVTARLQALQPGAGNVIIAGYIASLRVRSGRRGRMAELRLDDRTARVPVTVYSDVYQKFRAELVKDVLIVLRGKVEQDDFYENGYTVNVTEVLDLAEIRGRRACLQLTVTTMDNTGALLPSLKSLLMEHRGGQCQVELILDVQAATAPMPLGNDWRVRASDELLENLAALLGPDNVKLVYSED